MTYFDTGNKNNVTAFDNVSVSLHIWISQIDQSFSELSDLNESAQLLLKVYLEHRDQLDQRHIVENDDHMLPAHDRPCNFSHPTNRLC